MSMFENFPYTNLHELNLEWVIQKVKSAYSPDNPPENIVISVNGENGEVTLYKDAHIVFPDITSTQWNMYRNSDGKITGIEFNKDAPATRINGNLRFVIYDAGNPPPYPVVSVNGATGAIELYTEAYVEFPNLEGDNWGIQRKLNADTENEIMIGLMLNDDGDLSIIKGEEGIPVYSEDNPPPYPVRSVDGMTGNVQTWGYNTASKINIPRPAPGDEWSIGRVIDQGGNLSIKIMYDDNIQKCSAYMVYEDGVNTPTLIKLLTLDDIPTSSGVVSFNGQTGVVVIKGSDLIISNSDTRTIAQGFSDMETTDNNIKGSLAYVENTNTATQNIPSGAYVIWQNNDYISTQAISIGDTLSGTNLTPLNAGGITNNLKNTLNTNKANVSNYPNTNKILTSTTDDTTVGFKIEYPSTGTFSILYTDVYGRVAHIYRSSGNANLYMINGAFNANSLGQTESFLNVGNWVRAQMIITGSDTVIDNIQVTAYST